MGYPHKVFPKPFRLVWPTQFTIVFTDHVDSTKTTSLVAQALTVAV